MRTWGGFGPARVRAFAYPVLSIEAPADGGGLCKRPVRGLGLVGFNLRQCLAGNPGPCPCAAGWRRTTHCGHRQNDRAAGFGIGLVVDHIASGGDAQSLLADLREKLPQGTRILLPQAANAKPLLVDGLRYAGFEVIDPIAYVTKAQVPDVALPLARICAVTLASSATVERFLRAIGPGTQHQLVQQQIQWVAIGRQTFGRCLEHGLGPLSKAAEPTAQALAQAVKHVW